jgi:cytochrome P450
MPAPLIARPAAAPSRDPPAPDPPETLPGFVGFLRALSCNPVEAWPRAAYDEPYLHWRGRGLRPDVLFVTDPPMVRHILLDRVSVYDKGDIVRRRLSAALGDSMLVAPEESWRAQRRAVSAMFAPRRVEALHAAMIAAVDAAAAPLDALPDGAVVDIHDLMIALTYQVISRTLFSSDGVSDPQAFSHAIAGYFDTLGRVDLASYLNLPAWVPTTARLKARTPLALFRREIGGIIARRMARLERDGIEALPDDLLTRLLTAKHPDTGEPMPANLVYDNALTFLAAGHETTANTLCWVLFLLSDYPDWQARVVAELNRVVATADPTPDRLRDLVVTRMVLDETLRLYPPAPFIPRQALRDDRCGPVDVRRGTLVFTSPFVAHRHTAYWDNPRAFNPARFAGNRRETIDRFLYFPFGAGPRVCIGAGFAVQEILIVLARLLTRWRFTATRPDAVKPLATITLTPAPPLPMRVERR